MSRFRPIQPRLAEPVISDDDKPAVPELAVRKRKGVSQACYHCRKAKTKCDSARPKCKRCDQKSLECAYEFDNEEGQSRSQAIGLRLERLQRLVDNLQDGLEQPDALSHDQQGHIGKGKGKEVNVASAEDFKTVGPPQARTEASPLLLTSLLAQFQLPDAATTTRALEGFFCSSGKLFHVFSRGQVARCFDAVFVDRIQATSESRAMMCRLFAVAAIGAQYIKNSLGSEMEEALYDIAEHNLDTLLEEHPLDAIKVCTLLCMYNIMNKATVSLAYVEVGLGLCRRFGLDSRHRPNTEIPDAMWVDYRKSWRTLMFLSSRTNRNAKISLLKSQILQMQLAFKDLTARTVESIMSQLQGWYDQLPEQMHLFSTSQEDLSVEVKRSISYIHLLYLGAIMLTYRRVIAQYVQFWPRDGKQHVLEMLLSTELFKFGHDAVLAAAASARILRLLREDNGIFRRCWLVIFQSYTSCIILLHSAGQMWVRKLPPSTWHDHLVKASYCLDVLDYCGSADTVAAQFRDKLGAIYDSLRAHDSGEQPESSLATAVPDAVAARDGEPDPPDYKSPPQQDPALLLDLPADADPAEAELLRSLIVMLCRPFGDMGTRDPTEKTVKGQGWREDPGRYEYPQLMERLEWDFEASMSFQWDFEKLGVVIGSYSGGSEGRTSGQTGPWNRFLGSVTPSGWAPSPAFPR